MLLKKLEQKQKVLSTSSLKPTKINLKRAYRALRSLEYIPKFKTAFSQTIKKKGICIARPKKFLFLIPYGFRLTVIIQPDEDWLLIFIHEFVHVLLFKDYGYDGHGPIFNKLHEHVIDKYFDKILQSLLELQKEDEEKKQNRKK